MRALKVTTASLYLTLYSMGSQWRDLSVGVMWSVMRVRETTLARAASDVYSSTSWHAQSDRLTRLKDDGIRLVWVDCEAIVQEPGVER